MAVTLCSGERNRSLLCSRICADLRLYDPDFAVSSFDRSSASLGSCYRPDGRRGSADVARDGDHPRLGDIHSSLRNESSLRVVEPIKELE